MIAIRPLSEDTGVEITGVDVRGLDDDGFASIYRAWLDYDVAVVRDQTIEIEDFIAYSRRFGHVVPHPSRSTRHPDHPEVTLLGVDKFHADGRLNEEIYRRGAASWHTDGAYDEVPFKATLLYALAVPSRGGDTGFSSMHRAWDALPVRLKSLLERRRGTFTYGGGKRGSDALLNPEDRGHDPVFHPVIRTHSETGRKSLYFDPGKIVYVEGLEPADSDPLIDEIEERMVVADASCYDHRWRVGDIVIRDNRCMVHKAAGDYPPQ